MKDTGRLREIEASTSGRSWNHDDAQTTGLPDRARHSNLIGLGVNPREYNPNLYLNEQKNIMRWSVLQ